MKSTVVHYLLWHICIACMLLSPAVAENITPVSSPEGNKIATLKTFPSKDAAERFAEELRLKGFEIEVTEGTTKDNETIYKVSGKRHPESIKDTLSSEGVKHDEKLTPDKRNDLEQRALQSIVILSPRERAEFRNVDRITFSWLSVPQAVSYHVILARDRTFKNVVQEVQNVTGTAYTMEVLDYGTYFFQVRSRLSDDAGGPSSETLSFIIVPPKPSTEPLDFLESGSS